MTLEHYFAEWDPMDFIKDLDAPKDEYLPEAESIMKQYVSSMTPDQLGELTYRVFVEMIELDHGGFKEDAISRGGVIKELLENSRN